MLNKPRILVIGAGSIGRSFIGQIFARGGWEVVFSDVDSRLVAELNRRRSYFIYIKRPTEADEAILVAGVRAVDGKDKAAVATELATADLAALSVGKANLSATLPSLAAGLLERERLSHQAAPLDLIIAENDREAHDSLHRGLVKLLPRGFPLKHRLGLVRTSIGKMVPIMRAADLATDQLQLFAEAYNRLIVDRRAFLGPLPKISQLCPVDNIRAYEDRKLFIHNLGHAACAYLGFQTTPQESYIHRVLEQPAVREGARQAMTEAAAALALAYPKDLSLPELTAHIDELLSRFSNAALGDTIYRVGRDLPRKLARSDRLLGAALLCQQQAQAWPQIAAVFKAALNFAALDENGLVYPADEVFRAELKQQGLKQLFQKRLGLNPADPIEAAVMRQLL